MSEAACTVACMSTITTALATTARWDDVQHALTGGGDGASCQCIWPMLSNKDWNGTTVPQRTEMLREEIADGPPPGLIAYVDGEPAAWVRVGPRTDLQRWVRTKAITALTEEPLDDPEVWAISCFSVRKEHRGKGLNRRLLDAAIDHARANGARVIEAYPVDPTAGRKKPSNDLYHGVLSTFEAAGFEIVGRPKPDTALVSLTLR